MPKDINENYFYFRKPQRLAIIAICVTVFCFAALPYAYDYFYLSKQKSTPINREQLALLEQLEKDTTSRYDGYASDYTPYKNYNNSGYKNYSKNKYDNTPLKYRLFEFDPNTTSKQNWIELGVREKTADGILNYISKGGRFRQPEDINKIWGIDSVHKARLLPYIKITEVATNYANTKYPERQPYVPKKIEPININTADTTAWATLPGIGPGYARRIIRYRDQLGGFYATKQVAETYMMPDSVFQKILPYLLCNPNEIQKININTATEENLKQHPKIRWQLAKLIVAYRTQHGKYKNIEELTNIMIITPEVMKEIGNYVKVE